VIDPVLDYASYFGGNESDTITAIVSDTAGNVYVTGQTQPSTSFPPSPLVGESAQGGLDAILTKFDPTGKTVLFTAILGSSGNDSARNIAVDAASNIYLVGQAGAANFPVLNAYQPSVGDTDQSPTPWSAFSRWQMPDSSTRERDVGVPCGPRGSAPPPRATSPLRHKNARGADYLQPLRFGV
jgi:hypothetical protein